MGRLSVLVQKHEMRIQDAALYRILCLIAVSPGKDLKTDRKSRSTQQSAAGQHSTASSKRSGDEKLALYIVCSRREIPEHP